MLSKTDLATIRAALWYWQEECAVHGTTAQLPYFDQPDVRPLTFDQVGRLRDRLRNCTLHALSRQDAQSLLRKVTDGGATTPCAHQSDPPPAALLLSTAPDDQSPGG